MVLLRSRAGGLLLVVALLVLLGSTTYAEPICAGDCNGSGDVTVNELITLVNIPLGNADVSSCAQGIPTDVTVDISLIVRAVNNALNGCPTVSALVPTSGPSGTLVTVLGAGFSRGSKVTFGSVAAAVTTFVSTEELLTIVPLGPAGDGAPLPAGSALVSVEGSSSRSFTISELPPNPNPPGQVLREEATAIANQFAEVLPSVVAALRDLRGTATDPNAQTYLEKLGDLLPQLQDFLAAGMLPLLMQEDATSLALIERLLHSDQLPLTVGPASSARQSSASALLGDQFLEDQERQKLIDQLKRVRRFELLLYLASFFPAGKCSKLTVASALTGVAADTVELVLDHTKGRVIGFLVDDNDPPRPSMPEHTVRFKVGETKQLYAAIVVGRSLSPPPESATSATFAEPALRACLKDILIDVTIPEIVRGLVKGIVDFFDYVNKTGCGNVPADAISKDLPISFSKLATPEYGGPGPACMMIAGNGSATACPALVKPDDPRDIWRFRLASTLVVPRTCEANGINETFLLEGAPTPTPTVPPTRRLAGCWQISTYPINQSSSCMQCEVGPVYCESCGGRSGCNDVTDYDDHICLHAAFGGDFDVQQNGGSLVATPYYGGNPVNQSDELQIAVTGTSLTMTRVVRSATLTVTQTFDGSLLPVPCHDAGGQFSHRCIYHSERGNAVCKCTTDCAGSAGGTFAIDLLLGTSCCWVFYGPVYGVSHCPVKQE